jgi:pyruvate dehydrogenase E2 component (dihydrolipoamide acetyltransferase)
METGKVVSWAVQPGDTVSPGQDVCEVETDKAVVAVQAVEGGKVGKIVVPVGAEAPVGAVICVLLGENETPADLPAAQEKPLENALTSAPVEQQAAAAALTVQKADHDGVLSATWKARSLAKQHGVDLHQVEGSGPGGRIQAADVEGAAGGALPAVPAAEIKISPVAARLAEKLGLPLAGVMGSGTNGQIMQEDVLAAASAIIRGQKAAAPQRSQPRVKEVIPLKGVRGITSQRMAESASATARVTLFREVDASALVDLRQRYKERGEQVSYNDILMRVCASALAEHPAANARMLNGQIELLEGASIGLAMDTDRGLLVPVVHNTDQMTIPQIAAATQRLVQAARSGRVSPDDLSGGTFTITNLGGLGVEGFTPVINLPESCILGVGKIVRKPVVVDEYDSIGVRPCMTLSLVFDHRVLDGAAAARFLDCVAQMVESPVLMLTASHS